MDMDTDTYIVRIYRRDTLDPRRVSGVVEIVGEKRPLPFANYDELLAVLRGHRPPSATARPAARKGAGRARSI